MQLKNLGVILIILFTACSKDDTPYFRDINYFFNADVQGWKGMFADYPVGQDSLYELEFAFENLPAPIDTHLMGVKISGNNLDGDLFSYMYVPVKGLSPNTNHLLSFNIDLASNISKRNADPANSPNLFIGIGALDTIPTNFTDQNNFYRPSFPVEIQNGMSNGFMQVIGNLGVSDTTTVYTPITRGNIDNPMEVRSNNNGELYLLVGWDSGYLGKITVYIKSIKIHLEYP